jgi:hypothetical protein
VELPGERGGGPVPLVKLWCQKDINCPEGLPYQQEKRAVAQGYDGSYVCSGQLVGNARQDCANYYLTAAHCEWFLDPATMVYYWNFENSTCGGDDAPWDVYSTGSWHRFSITDDADSDVTLMELFDNLDPYDVYYMGWTRSTVPSAESAMISFPDGQPKQITIDTDTLIDCAAGPCAGGWGPNYWRVTSWEVGVDEIGSSGGGLMNQDRLLVGQLTGGIGTDCDDFRWDEFAKLSVGMDLGMAAFLDPDSSGVESVPGMDNSVCSRPMAVEVTPESDTVPVGSDIVFTAAATGGALPHGYQWTENGADIPGAVDSTHTANKSTSGTWSYNCKVSDASGQHVDVTDPADSTGTWEGGIPPEEVSGPASPQPLRWSSKGRITWEDRGDCDSYRLYRGVAGDLPGLLDASDDSCLRWTGVDPFTGEEITEDPPAGDLFWFLVTGENAAGEGPAGNGRTVDPAGGC